jgi:hypothetical protein
MPNPIPSPLKPCLNDYYSYSVSNSAPPNYALNKEPHNTTEWTFHDNETEYNGLSQPPELLMSCKSQNPEAQAFMGETQFGSRPLPKPPDEDSEATARSDPKSGI